jgi:hypothetical protein
MSTHCSAPGASCASGRIWGKARGSGPPRFGGERGDQDPRNLGPWHVALSSGNVRAARCSCLSASALQPWDGLHAGPAGFFGKLWQLLLVHPQLVAACKPVGVAAFAPQLVVACKPVGIAACAPSASCCL